MSGANATLPIVEELVVRLAAIEGVVAVALGGSYARGTQRSDSDIDLGLYYRDGLPFSIDALKDITDDVDDSGRPAITDFGGWGRWVNGGAWLTISGQRVDFIYRSLDDIERVIGACRRGEPVWDYLQQPPYGFHNHIYLGELSICRPLHDPTGVLTALKRKLDPYPEALKRSIASKRLRGVEFDLTHARKFAERGDVYNTAGCLTRCAAQLVQVVYALNERYFISDKGALEEIEAFSKKPPDFPERLRAILARPGASGEELLESVERTADLHRELIERAGGLYERPKFRA